MVFSFHSEWRWTWWSSASPKQTAGQAVVGPCPQGRPGLLTSSLEPDKWGFSPEGVARLFSSQKPTASSEAPGAPPSASTCGGGASGDPPHPGWVTEAHGVQMPCTQGQDKRGFRTQTGLPGPLSHSPPFRDCLPTGTMSQSRSCTWTQQFHVWERVLGRWSEVLTSLYYRESTSQNVCCPGVFIAGRDWREETETYDTVSASGGITVLKGT